LKYNLEIELQAVANELDVRAELENRISGEISCFSKLRWRGCIGFPLNEKEKRSTDFKSLE
jgi:hypothetical protein